MSAGAGCVVRARTQHQADLREHYTRRFRVPPEDPAVPSRARRPLRLAEALGLELRERNPLLLAAGYAPVYHETSLEAPYVSAVRDMAAHEPYPAVVLDRYWNRVDANEPARLFGQGVHPGLLPPKCCAPPTGRPPFDHRTDR